MNARLVSTVAGEIRCAQVRGIITASGLADVLAAAQLLQSPETVAEVRAAALREAADAVWGMAYDEDAEDYGYDSIRDAWDGGTMDAAKYLRRMVDTAAKASPAREQSEPCPEHSPAAELARLRDLVAAVRALHTKYSDSDHCTQDDEQWPCLTLCALDADAPSPATGTCGRALSTGQPCPDHPAAPAEIEQLRARVAELETEAAAQRRTGYQVAIRVMRQEKLPMSVELLEAELELEALDVPEPRKRSAGAYPPALPWARLMDDADLAEFLAEVEHAIATPGATPTEALGWVERACGTWRLIAEAQHAHNTSPGPDKNEMPDGITRLIAPTQALQVDEAGEGRG